MAPYHLSGKKTESQQSENKNHQVFWDRSKKTNLRKRFAIKHSFMKSLYTYFFLLNTVARFWFDDTYVTTAMMVYNFLPF